jgi:hypothetical protein
MATSARSTGWHALDMYNILVKRRDLLRSIRVGWQPLFLYPALLSVGAGMLASCSGKETAPQPRTSAISLLPQSSPEVPAPPPPAPRPARKPAPPTTESPAPATGGETLAMTAPKPSGSGLVSPSSAPPGSEAITTSLGPAEPPPLQTSDLIGLDQPAAARLLGPATERSEQPPATVWRYKNATCELDLFFYLDLSSGRMRTLHYALKGDGGDKAKRQDCLRSLLAERGN